MTAPARTRPQVTSGVGESPLRPDGIPMSILIDREGNMVGTLTGATEWDSPAALELVGRYLAN